MEPQVTLPDKPRHTLGYLVLFVLMVICIYSGYLLYVKVLTLPPRQTVSRSHDASASPVPSPPPASPSPLPAVRSISPAYTAMDTVLIARDGFKSSLLETETTHVISFSNSDTRDHVLSIQGHRVPVLAESMTGYRFDKGGVYDVLDQTTNSKILILVQ